MPDARPWEKHYPESVRSFRLEGELTMARLLADSVGAHAGKVALVFEGQTMTYEELHDQAHQFAVMLADVGVVPGDRVAICLPNRPEYVVALLGATISGAIAVQVNHRYPRAEIDQLLQDCDARVVVATDSTAARCDTGTEGFLGRYFVRVATDPAAPLPHETGRDYHELEWYPAGATLPRAPAPDDIAVLQYTGGTTGRPKAVMLTHRNLTANVLQRCAMTYDLMEIPEGATSINVLPMCHVYGLTSVTLSGFRCGLTQVLLETFDVDQVLQIIAETAPFVFTGVPTMYASLIQAENAESAGLDRVQIYNSAGAGFPLAQMERFEAVSGRRIIEGFGLSEASPATHVNPLFIERRPGSVGLPLPLTDVRIVATEGGSTDPLPVGTVGELLIRGPQVMRGYWNRSDETAAALRGGWLATGDTAHMDEDGFLYIDGRLKDVVISSGFNVYPAEVEGALLRHPAVLEAAVVGLPDANRGETVVAFVVADPGTPVDAGELTRHCRTLLAAYKVPSRIVFSDGLPRTPVGKIAKNQLREPSAM